MPCIRRRRSSRSLHLRVLRRRHLPQLLRRLRLLLPLMSLLERLLPRGPNPIRRQMYRGLYRVRVFQNRLDRMHGPVLRYGLRPRRCQS